MKKISPHEGALFTSAELAEAIGADLETVKNWLRRGIISRPLIGGRQMRNRLFSAEEVYKAAITYELVKLGLGPSAAAIAVKTMWPQCTRSELFELKQIHAILYPTENKWSVVMGSQHEPGGPLYRLTRSAGRSREKVRLPDKAFVVVPISGTLTRIANRLETIIGATHQPSGAN